MFERHRPSHRVLHALIGLGLLPLTISGYAVAAPGQADKAMMGVTVLADRVLIGPEFIPRRLDLPSKLIVPTGQVVELAADSVFDYIEVSGTLRASRLHNTTLQFVHLIVLPGGVLDIGTPKDPIPCGISVRFILRNVPIDTNIDPYQWGNGLVNFGRETRVGCAKTAFVQTTDSLAAGETEVTLATTPTGWQVGDELLIPDTAVPSKIKASTPGGNVYVSRREATLTIEAIDGALLTLSKPLDFEHRVITTPNGTTIVRPRIANLTRNIVVQSEELEGVRGHTVDIGMNARWDIEYNQLIDLGRTLARPIDSTVLPHIGTNQVGKYAEHHHHADSARGSVDIGNVYQGNPTTTKWALVVHGTSDVLVQDCIAVDFPGAGFVTEDGYEVRNVFRHNLAAYSIGSNPIDAVGFRGDFDFQQNCPGCEGSGFWFHGVMNTFDGNEGWNSFRGINLFNQLHVAGKYPSQPGAMADTPNDNHKMRPIEMRDNIAVGNTMAGYEFWAVNRFPNVNLTVANNRQLQAIGVQSDQIEHYYQNPMIVCAQVEGLAPSGIHADFAYTSSFEVDGGYIGGCAYGVNGGGGARFEKLHATTLQNAVNITEVPGAALFDHVMHLPLGNLPHQYIVMNDANFNSMGGPRYIWNGTDPLPSVGTASKWVPQRGSQFIVLDWQGTGKDYRLFTLQQLGNNPAWYSGPYKHMFNAPVQGLTMLQSWQQFGLSYGGDVLAERDAVDLDGLIYGKARAGLDVKFSPPRAIVTFPTMRAPALGPSDDDPAKTGYVKIYAILTGDPNAPNVSNVMWYTVDGDKPTAWGSHGEQSPAQDTRTFNTPHATPGTHTVKVWRTYKDGVTPIPGSDYTTQYYVVRTPIAVAVPNVVGLTQQAASSAVANASLKVGTVTQTSSDTVPAGQVISQTPRAGASVATGTVVGFVLSLGTPR